MLRQYHIKLQHLSTFMRGYSAAKEQNNQGAPEAWANKDSAQYEPGMIIFCLEPVAPPPGLSSGKKDAPSPDMFRVKDCCVVVNYENKQPLVVNITTNAYELRFLEVLLSEKARKAVLDGRDFRYVAVKPANPLDAKSLKELEKLGTVYSQGGSRRSLAVDNTEIQEPAIALLSALGANIFVTGLGKQVLDIGSICQMIFTPDSPQEDKNKTSFKNCFTPLPADSSYIPSPIKVEEPLKPIQLPQAQTDLQLMPGSKQRELIAPERSIEQNIGPNIVPTPQIENIPQPEQFLSQPAAQTGDKGQGQQQTQTTENNSADFMEVSWPNFDFKNADPNVQGFGGNLAEWAPNANTSWPPPQESQVSADFPSEFLDWTDTPVPITDHAEEPIKLLANENVTSSIPSSTNSSAPEPQIKNLIEEKAIDFSAPQEVAPAKEPAALKDEALSKEIISAKESIVVEKVPAKEIIPQVIPEAGAAKNIAPPKETAKPKEIIPPKEAIAAKGAVPEKDIAPKDVVTNLKEASAPKDTATRAAVKQPERTPALASPQFEQIPAGSKFKGEPEQTKPPIEPPRPVETPSDMPLRHRLEVTVSGSRKAASVKETKAVMNEMATLMNKLELQVAKAAKRLSSQAIALKKTANEKVEVYVKDKAQAQKENVSSLLQNVSANSRKLDEISEEIHLNVAETAANGRYSVKQLLPSNQEKIDEKKEKLYQALKDECLQFHSSSDEVTHSNKRNLEDLVHDHMSTLESLINDVLKKLEETKSHYNSKFNVRLERFQQRLSEEIAFIGQTLERNVQSMIEEVDSSSERASEKLKAATADYEQTIHHTVKTAQLNITRTARRIINETLIPELRDRREILRAMCGEMAKRFSEESQSQARAQVIGLEGSLSSARQQLQALAQECTSGIENIGASQQNRLEQVFKETSLHVEELITKVEKSLASTQQQIAESDAFCKKLAETTSVDTDPELTERRGLLTNKMLELRHEANAQLQSAIELKSAHLEELSHNVQNKLGNLRTERIDNVKGAAEKGLSHLKEAIQEAFAAIQSDREKYME